MEKKLIEALALSPEDIEAKPINIGNKLNNLQKFVGGLIEVVELDGDIDMIVNEEGLLIRLPLNLVVNKNMFLVGPILFVGHDEEGNFTSLTAANRITVNEFVESCQIKKMMFYMGLPLDMVDHLV